MASINYLGDDETELLPPLTDEERAAMLGPAPGAGVPLVDVPPPAGALPSAVSAPAAIGPPVIGPANKALAAELAQQPVLQQPHWWQRALAGALGAGVGYTNAAGRVRQPIDDTAAVQGILAPGYSSKLAEWKSRVAPLEQATERETANNQAWWKNAGSQADIRYKNAHADYMEGVGRTPASVEVTPEMAEVSGGILKAGTKVPAALGTELVRVAAGKYEKQDKTMVVSDPDLAGIMGVKPGTAVPQALYQAAVSANNRKQPNLNPTDILLHPDDFDQATVKRAQGVFDREHKPTVVNVGGSEPSTPPPSSDLPRLKAIANGDIPAPSPRSKNYNQTMDWVYQLDPTYTEGRYLGKKGFQNSKDSQNIGTITRIMGHLDRFDKNSAALGTSPLLSTNITGAQRRLHIDADAISAELGKLVHGGVLTQSEADRARNNLLSPLEGTRKQAIDEVNQLMDSQFEGIYQRYKGATNQEFPTAKYFDKATQQRLAKRGSLPNIGGQSGTGPGEAAPTGGPITVTDPRGVVHTFPDQASADTFKKLANIK